MRIGCNTTGVRGVRLGEGDKVVSLIVPRGDGAILHRDRRTVMVSRAAVDMEYPN